MALPPVLDLAAYAGLNLVAPVFLPHLDEISPLKAIAGIPDDVPVLILAGGGDHLARPDEARALHEQVASHGRLVFFPGAGHGDLLRAGRSSTADASWSSAGRSPVAIEADNDARAIVLVGPELCARPDPPGPSDRRHPPDRRQEPAPKVGPTRGVLDPHYDRPASPRHHHRRRSAIPGCSPGRPGYSRAPLKRLYQVIRFSQ